MTNFAQRTAPSTTTRDPWPHPPSLSRSSGPFSRSTSPCLKSRWKQWGAWRSPVKTRTPTLTAETWWTTTGLLALLAAVLWESPAKKGVILHRSLEKGPLSKESCFKLQASRWRTYFRKWCTMESFNMAPFLIHPSLDFNHLSFRNVFNRSQ